MTDARWKVVGETYRQTEIAQLFQGIPGFHTFSGAELRVPTALGADFGNPYDSNAIAIWVGGRHVGYLERALATRSAPAAGRPRHHQGQRTQG